MQILKHGDLLGVKHSRMIHVCKFVNGMVSRETPTEDVLLQVGVTGEIYVAVRLSVVSHVTGFGSSLWDGRKTSRNRRISRSITRMRSI